MIVIQANYILVQTPNRIIGKWKDKEQSDKQTEFFLALDGTYSAKLIGDGANKENAGAIIMKKLVYNVKLNTYKGFMCPPNTQLEIDTTLSFLFNQKNSSKLCFGVGVGLI
jgi:hypothetical protein